MGVLRRLPLARLHQELDMKGRPTRSERRTRYSVNEQPRAPTRLQRRFEAPRRCRIWVSETTYLAIAESGLHPAVQLDICLCMVESLF